MNSLGEWFGKWFGYAKGDQDAKAVPIIPPDDSELQHAMNVARQENRDALSKLVRSSRQQKRDALFARQVISDVLTRAEKLRELSDENHASSAKE